MELVKQRRISKPGEWIIDNKPQDRDLRKHFEAILGHEIGDNYCVPTPEAGGVSLHPTSPIILVATAQSQEPIFVTTRTLEVPGVVRIVIYMWEPGGAPAKGKLVKWICLFPLAEVVN